MIRTYRTAGVAIALSAFLSIACDSAFDFFGVPSATTLRLYLVNESTTRYVSPNPGLCAEGLEAGTKRFLDVPPVIAPGEAVSYTSFEIGGQDGICSGDNPQFMIGLCGWKHGASAEDLSPCSKRYGGQIGFQFQCGDTIILRWTDAGDIDGTWTSEILSALGNGPPAADFQYIDGGGGSCTQ